MSSVDPDSPLSHLTTVLSFFLPPPPPPPPPLLVFSRSISSSLAAAAAAAAAGNGSSSISRSCFDLDLISNSKWMNPSERLTSISCVSATPNETSSLLLAPLHTFTRLPDQSARFSGTFSLFLLTFLSFRSVSCLCVPVLHNFQACDLLSSCSLEFSPSSSSSCVPPPPPLHPSTQCWHK